MKRGAFLLALLCLGCQTFYLVPEKSYQQAKQDPDQSHTAVRAFRLPGNGCSLDIFNAQPTFIKLQEVEIVDWVVQCTHCAKIRNRSLIAGITLLALGVASMAGAFAMQYSPCGDADCEKRRPGAVGGLALLAVLGGLTGSVLTPIGARDAVNRPWELNKNTPSYHFYEVPPEGPNSCNRGRPSVASAR